MNSIFALILGYINPALNNWAQVFMITLRLHLSCFNLIFPLFLVGILITKGRTASLKDLEGKE